MKGKEIERERERERVEGRVSKYINVTRSSRDSPSLFRQRGISLHAKREEPKEGLKEIFKSELRSEKSSLLNNNAMPRIPLFSGEEHDISRIPACRSFGSKERRAGEVGRDACRERE